MPDYIDSADMRLHRSAPEVPVGGVQITRAVYDAAQSIPQHYRVIDGSDVREMTTAEKDAVVSTWQAMHAGALVSAATAYTAGHYPQWQDIVTEYGLAKVEARLAAVSYLDPTIAWLRSISAEYRARRNAILAATTHDGVYAVSLDFTTLDADKPATVSVADAREMGVV